MGEDLELRLGRDLSGLEGGVGHEIFRVKGVTIRLRQGSLPFIIMNKALWVC